MRKDNSLLLESVKVMMSAKLQFYQSIYLKINFISIKFHNDSYCELERIFKGPITPVRFTVLRSLVNDNSGRARGEDDFFLFFYIIFLDIILISYWVKYARIWVFYAFSGTKTKSTILSLYNTKNKVFH